MYKIDEAQEKKEILRRYRLIFKSFKREISQEEHDAIHKAFVLAVTAHGHTRRKSGEPYIYHPLEVAHIVVEDIGLGPTAVVCALLHDVVEDTEYTLTDIENGFGPTVARIVDGLTKIDAIFDQNQSFSIQAENFKKLLFSLSDDVRVILIKLADRLHNMRTLDSMARDKQLKIASETINVYAPLAHRLGLFSIKSELEDLAMKLNISYSWFRRIFKEYTGYAPAKYFQELKLRKAKQLLIDTPLSVKEISFSLGFQSTEYFFMFFKKHTGFTPLGYRAFGKGEQEQK